MYSTCSDRLPDTNANIELCVSPPLSPLFSLPTTILSRILPTNLNTGGFNIYYIYIIYFIFLKV
jgi:hypothetical protein